MAKKPLSYKEKLDLIKSYTDLDFPKRKLNAKNPSFTPAQKSLITRYYNQARNSGFFDTSGEQLIPKVKYVRGKTGQQKGAPRFKGRFIKGAAPSDKIKGNKIISGNYDKIQIPMNFSGFEASEEAQEEQWEYPGESDLYEQEYEQFVIQIVFDALTPYYEDLKFGDYFTIYLANGWEIGRSQQSGKNWKNKRGQPIAEDLEGEEKFLNLANKIFNLLVKGVEQYKMDISLVAGVYLWKFKNQRQPTRKEKAAIKGKSKKKRGRK